MRSGAGCTGWRLHERWHGLRGHGLANSLAPAGVEGPVHAEIDATDLVLFDPFLQRKSFQFGRMAPVLSVVTPFNSSDVKVTLMSFGSLLSRPAKVSKQAVPKVAWPDG